MTVSELIEKLKEMPQDNYVYVPVDSDHLFQTVKSVEFGIYDDRTMNEIVLLQIYGHKV